MNQLLHEPLKKLGIRKDVSVAFQTKLNKIEEIDETEKKPRGRPKSATFLEDIEIFETDSRKRPKSSEPVRAKIRKQKKPFEVRECCCCCRECVSLLDFESRSSSGLDEPSYRFLNEKCRSEPCFPKSRSQREVHKIKRSLRLLGFELSDFGIQPCRKEKTEREKSKPSVFTKIRDRSLSLESLRAIIKRAWTEDSLDETHRRLLARAAYEEWYFKKERELWKKKEEEKMLRLKVKENLREDFLKKKAKSEEEFQKWLQRKRTKRKENKENIKTPFRGTKTKEESEEAFLKWKKSKEKEIEKKKKEKKKEEEKRKESERQKAEKKLIAEKAFKQWKAKLEEEEKLKEAKRERIKKKQEAEVRKQRKNESEICFQTWKAAKDEEIKERMRRIREAEEIARAERLTRMEERMYEAEQAFEDWLEKIDLRRRKYSGSNAYQKTIPWIPA